MDNFRDLGPKDMAALLWTIGHLLYGLPLGLWLLVQLQFFTGLTTRQAV